MYFNIWNFCLYIEPPRFVKKPGPFSMLRKGESTTFQCQIAGTPEIKVTWYLDGNDITTNGKYEISFVDGISTLDIINSTVEDSGMYVCEATNEAGSESCSIDVKVQG